MSKALDLVGKKFGKLTVIRKGNGKKIGKAKKLRTTYICICECGKEIEILTSNLTKKQKNTRSCGKCNTNPRYNFVDITGQKFNQLLVVKRLEKKTKTRGVLWECLCDCGNTIELPTNALTSENNITCGDYKKHFELNISSRTSRYGEIPSAHLNAIKQNAIKRNLQYSVSGEYLWNLFLQQNKKCFITGIELFFTKESYTHKYRYETTASLDRIDSSLGYIEGNVRWVHKDINKMMNNYGDEKFLQYCIAAVNNHFSKLPRPTWDEYFLNIAFDISNRSQDPNIKHGAVLVNSDHHIIGTGFNGPMKGAFDTEIPFNNRDEKRKWMIHAEENCLLNCTQSYANRKDSVLYVTGEPCNTCLQRICNFGIKNIVVADRVGSITENNQTRIDKQKILNMAGIKISVIPMNNLWIIKNTYGL